MGNTPSDDVPNDGSAVVEEQESMTGQKHFMNVSDYTGPTVVKRQETSMAMYSGSIQFYNDLRRKDDTERKDRLQKDEWMIRKDEQHRADMLQKDEQHRADMLQKDTQHRADMLQKDELFLAQIKELKEEKEELKTEKKELKERVKHLTRNIQNNGANQNTIRELEQAKEKISDLELEIKILNEKLATRTGDLHSSGKIEQLEKECGELKTKVNQCEAAMLGVCIVHEDSPSFYKFMITSLTAQVQSLRKRNEDLCNIRTRVFIDDRAV